jgi:hypothetical protein
MKLALQMVGTQRLTVPLRPAVRSGCRRRLHAGGRNEPTKIASPEKPAKSPVEFGSGPISILPPIPVGGRGEQVDHFVDARLAISDPRFHGRRASDCLMDADELVAEEGRSQAVLK